MISSNNRDRDISAEDNDRDKNVDSHQNGLRDSSRLTKESTTSHINNVLNDKESKSHAALVSNLNKVNNNNIRTTDNRDQETIIIEEQVPAWTTNAQVSATGFFKICFKNIGFGFKSLSNFHVLLHFYPCN